jgi:hypothetical protein
VNGRVFEACELTSAVGEAVSSTLLVRSLKGEPSLVVAGGAARSGKTETLFGRQGVFVAFVAQLLYEFRRQRVSDLFEIQCSVCEVIGDEVIDVLQEDSAKMSSGRRCRLRLQSQADAAAVAEKISTQLEQSPCPRHIVAHLQPVSRIGEQSAVPLVLSSVGAISMVELCASLSPPSYDHDERAWQLASKRAKTSAEALLATVCRAEAATVYPGESELLHELAGFLDVHAQPKPQLHFLWHMNAVSPGRADDSTFEQMRRLVGALPEPLAMPDHRQTAIALFAEVKQLRRDLVRVAGRTVSAEDARRAPPCESPSSAPGELDRVHEELAAAHDECEVLRAQLHAANLRNGRGSGNQQSCRLMAPAASPAANRSADRDEGDAPAPALGPLRRHGVLPSWCRTEADAVHELVRQVADRERTIELLQKRRAVSDLLDSIASGGSPGVHDVSISPSLPTPSLGWQRWHAVLGAMSPQRHESDRHSIDSSKPVNAADFFSWWSRRSHATGDTPKSKLEGVLLDFD